ncbi:hypothetical protein [uncultured Roseibium sp.]|uniref:hypothetical protein n=1 Tax=uncultured Roseibium sp. TaxID=1936171 RepID=UPI00262EA3F6|nr:hypothetical protein [uncultured Roseibium sp.]
MTELYQNLSRGGPSFPRADDILPVLDIGNSSPSVIRLPQPIKQPGLVLGFFVGNRTAISKQRAAKAAIANCDPAQKTQVTSAKSKAKNTIC